jgi:hypothetical protein
VFLGISKKHTRLSLVPIAQDNSKRRKPNNHVNFQAESIALPPDAAGAASRPGQAIIFARPIRQPGIDTRHKGSGSHDNTKDSRPRRQR